MKALVLGFNPAFGEKAEEAMKNQGYEVWGIYFHPPTEAAPHRLQCNFLDKAKIDALVQTLPSFEVVINCATHADEPESVELNNGLRYLMEHIKHT